MQPSNVIKKPQQKKAKNKKTIDDGIDQKNNRKMPFFRCPCGVKILIVPDLTAMNKAIKNHIALHNKITWQRLTEENLTKEIIKVLSLKTQKS